MIKRIRKRDGQIVNFEPEKIGAAIARAFRAVEEGEDKAPSRLAETVARVLEELSGSDCRFEAIRQRSGSSEEEIPAKG